MGHMSRTSHASHKSQDLSRSLVLSTLLLSPLAFHIHPFLSLVAQLEEYTFCVADEKLLQVEGAEIVVVGPGGNAADTTGYYQQLSKERKNEEENKEEKERKNDEENMRMLEEENNGMKLDWADGRKPSSRIILSICQIKKSCRSRVRRSQSLAPGEMLIIPQATIISISPGAKDGDRRKSRLDR